MSRQQIVHDVVSDFATPESGFWFLIDREFHLVGGSQCKACEVLRRLSSSVFKDELIARLKSTAMNANPCQVGLPFGIIVSAVSLRASIESSCILFKIASVSRSSRNPLDLAILNAQPRKAKKLITKILEYCQSFEVQELEDTSQLLNEISHALKTRYEEWKETAFANTLASYKDFVSSFCHEALTPIQEIQLTLELALKDNAIQGLSHQRLDSSYRSLEGLRVSLEGMRLLFRDDHQKPLRNQFREIDLKSTVDRWLGSYSSQLQVKNIVPITEPNGTQPWKLTCVPEYIEILVKNLISNGVKYSFDASCFSDGEVGKFLVRFDAQQLKLSFVNFGVPISQSEIESGSLFELEKRGDSANDRGRVGKGVGLYLVARVASLHDAKITVQSQIRNPGGQQEFARNAFEIQFPKKSSPKR